MAAIDNLLYAVGGSNRDDGTRSNLNSMERYNPDKDEWEEMPPMHRSRGAASVTSLGGCLYAVGGYDSGMSVSACICLCVCGFYFSGSEHSVSVSWHFCVLSFASFVHPFLALLVV